jgi:isoamylase
VIGELAYRLTGSSDLYAHSGRRPYASINFVTAHDGFTLADLVSYNQKHNEANGEENRDGTDNNRSWNCGVEGATDDPEINALRARQKRNFLATLVLSQGVPMLLGGDPIGHTQRGNNNAYCQDNEVSWMNWDLKPEQRDLLAFTQLIIALRNNHPVFRRRKFFQGRSIKGAEIKDILWLRPDGKEMDDEEWKEESARSLGLYLSGQGLDEMDERGQPIRDENFLLLMNANHEAILFTLPALPPSESWVAIVDTSCEPKGNPGCRHNGEAHYSLKARSLVVLVARVAGRARITERRHEA